MYKAAGLAEAKTRTEMQAQRDAINQQYMQVIMQKMKQQYQDMVPSIPYELPNGEKVLVTRREYLELERIKNQSKSAWEKEYDFIRKENPSISFDDYVSSKMGDVGKYLMVRRQAEIAGKKPPSFESWLKSYRRSGATRISIGEAAERTAATTRAKDETRLITKGFDAALKDAEKEYEKESENLLVLDDVDPEVRRREIHDRALKIYHRRLVQQFGDRNVQPVQSAKTGKLYWAVKTSTGKVELVEIPNATK